VNETKSEINARIDELNNVFESADSDHLKAAIKTRILALQELMKDAPDDIFNAVLKSHKIICEVKHMGLKEAYGQHPALYYGAGVAGEAGEMCNKIVKAIRNGDDYEVVKAAIVSELPDVIIYGSVLAYHYDIDLIKETSDKAQIVSNRAPQGHYGGKLR
jgi:hypothetical protein